MVGVGDLPGGAFRSRATSISPDGSIIGGTGDSRSGEEAALWTPHGGMRGVYELLADAGVERVGWTLTAVTDIAADAQTCVGLGIDPDGHELGWIAHLSLEALSAGLR